MSTVSDNENQQTAASGAPGEPGAPGVAANAVNPGANTDASNDAEAIGQNGGAGGAGNVSNPNGGAGGAGGDAVASVTTTNPSASATSATVIAAGGTGGPGATPAPAGGGVWGAAGAAGTASGGATDGNSQGDATASVRVFGGAGGSGFAGQIGGAPRGYAIANGFSAYATFNIVGGNGGATYGSGPGGAGAGITITSASQGAIANATGTTAGDDNARAMLIAEGGNGGVGLAPGAGDAGDGGSVTLINAVGGTAVSGGNLTLIEHAAGGDPGGDSADGAGGAFGSAETDLTYLGFGPGWLTGNVQAQGGFPSEFNFPASNSGIGRTAGGAGGNAVANESLSGSGSVGGLVQAFGSGGGASQGTGAIGGSATATGTVATTATIANTSTITVSGDGGSGGAGGDAATNTSGDGGAAGDVKNVSAIAGGVGPTFAAALANPGQAPNVIATANAIQQGSGGAGVGDGIGGQGSGVDAISAQATISGTGLATATVSASGGAGGYVVGLKNGSGNGTGGAGAPITLDNAASGSTYLGWLFLNQTARGGAGGNGPTDTFDSTPLPLGAAGAAGTATSTLNLTGASANTTSLGLTTSVQAYGGVGGNAGGNGGAGANGTANDTADGIYSVVLSTRALGGAGGIAGSGVGGAGGGAYATGDAAAAPGTATVPMPANPGAYLFNGGAGRVTPIAQSYVFALGGSGGQSTGPDGTGGVGGNATATSTATGIGGTEGENAYASAIGGAGGAGTTAGTPGNATADATANAQKSGGTALAHGSASGGSASGTASALTVGGLLAVSTLRTTGGSGLATASATTNGGFITNAVASATAPSSTATSEAVATAWNQGAPDEPNGQLGGQGVGLLSYALEAPEVDQSNHFHNSATGAALGMGLLGGSYAAGGSGAQVFTSSMTLDVATAQVAAGSLEFFLNNPQYAGGAFDSLTFQVAVQGSTDIDRSFTSSSAADTFFTNDLLNLGAIPGTAGSGTLAVTVSLSETLASGNEYGINFSVGDVGGPPPSITGAVAGQPTTNTNPASPFSQVVVADLNTDQPETETVTVTLSDPANGTLSNPGPGTFNASTGVYTDSGSAAAVTTALDGLLFTPSEPDVPAGQSVTTGFEIKVIDSSSASADDNTTTVIDTAAAGPPAIGGTVAGQATSDTAAISPFANVTVEDPNFEQTETVTVTLSSPADGTLSNLGGGTFNAGVYSVTGSAASVTAALDGLVFTPTAHQVAPGQTVTTGFTIEDSDTSGQTASDTTTSVIVTTGTVPPAITGTVAGQATSDDTTIAPLANVTIADLNFGQTETVTVTLSALTNGELSNLGSGDFDPATGVYTDTGSAAAVTAALDGLMFTPSARQVAPGQTVTTQFTIADTDTSGQIASDSTTTVLATAETPRTLVWTGAASTVFDTAANWNDTTSNLDPATMGPGQADVVQFSGVSGGITGADTAWSMSFGGGGAWQLASGAALNVSGSVIAGSGQSGVLVIDEGSSLIAGSAAIASTATASGSSIEVSGPGSSFQVGGLLDVGVAGSGALDLSGGATVTAGTLDAGNVISAVANINVSDANFTVTGSATVADDGTGVMSVLSGATFSAAELTIGSQGDSSGALVVSGDNTIVNISGDLNVGTSLGTGDLTIGPGATVNALVVNLQGQVVLENGELDPTVNLINQGQTAGGSGTIAAGDIVDEGVIQAGGSKPSQKLLVVAGTVLGGGPWTINGTAQAQANGGAGILQINAGGTLELTGPVLNAASTTFTDDVTPQSTYTVNNSVVDVNFADATGVLKLDDIGGFAGTIAAFRAGDKFVVTGGTLSNAGVTGGNTLTVSDSGDAGTDDIIFSSGISASGFNIVNNNTIQVACFARGTRIAMELGLVAVEELSVDDRAVTNHGTCEPIVWIGQRTVNCRSHPKPENVWPVRVRAGAFGQNVPLRDLYLSPDHAVLVDGVLIPVKLLVNAASIVQVRRSAVTYFHIELPIHAVILAEGLTVESYLDLGDRTDFASDGDTIRLFPDFAARLAPDAAPAWETKGAAPLVMAGEKLRTAHQRLRDRAHPIRQEARNEGV